MSAGWSRASGPRSRSTLIRARNSPPTSRASAPGPGSEFSLLPAQNANGNWVKVTQRVPVRIAFNGMPVKPMIAGLSVTATVYFDKTAKVAAVATRPPTVATHPLPTGNGSSSPSG